MNILVTGAASFIGYSLSLRLLEAGHDVIGIDNLNDYYDTGFKPSTPLDQGVHHFVDWHMAYYAN